MSGKGLGIIKRGLEEKEGRERVIRRRKEYKREEK